MTEYIEAVERLATTLGIDTKLVTSITLTPTNYSYTTIDLNEAGKARKDQDGNLILIEHNVTA